MTRVFLEPILVWLTKSVEQVSLKPNCLLYSMLINSIIYYTFQYFGERRWYRDWSVIL